MNVPLPDSEETKLKIDALSEGHRKKFSSISIIWQANKTENKFSDKFDGLANCCFASNFARIFD